MNQILCILVVCVSLSVSLAASSRTKRLAEDFINSSPSDGYLRTPVPAGTGGFSCSYLAEDGQEVTLPNGKYPVDDCKSYFFECNDGSQYVVDCPNELEVYNMEIDQCLVGCFVGDNPEIDSSAAVPCEGFPNGFHAIAGACDRYAMCLNSVLFTITCDADKIFNRATRRCDDPLNVYGVCGVLDLPSLFSCSGRANGRYRSGMDCSLYYECLDEEIFLSDRCDAFFRFSNEAQACLYFTSVMECLPAEDLSLGESFCEVAGRDGLFFDPRSCQGSIICLYDDIANKRHAFSFVCTDPNEPDWNDETKRCGPPLLGCSAVPSIPAEGGPM